MIQYPINPDKRLPDNVFEGQWSTFLFFDSDWVFSPEFVGLCYAVLERESAAVVEIIDLDDPESRFVLEAETTWESYRRFLNGQEFDGWLYDVHRFAVSSDRQKWCIYLERDAEIAVFACKKDCASETLFFVTRVFKGLPIREIVTTENIAVFQRKVASNQFVRTLIQSFAGQMSPTADSPPSKQCG